MASPNSYFGIFAFTLIPNILIFSAILTLTLPIRLFSTGVFNIIPKFLNTFIISLFSNKSSTKKKFLKPSKINIKKNIL